MKFIHIIPNVIFGGGEQVLITLAEEKSKENFFYFLRKSSKIPKLENINNKSYFPAKDNYLSFFDHFINFISVFFVILKLKFLNEKDFSIVFHGFPCQFLILLSRIIHPNRKIFMIYHQIKKRHKGIFFILRILENIFIYIPNPIVGAPSKRALKSLKNYLFYFVVKKLRFFEFKNCFSPIKYCYGSEILYKEINSDKPYLLTVSRFDKQKGHLRLLKFIKNNTELSKKFNFIFVGDGKNFLECKKYIATHNLSNIQLLGSKNRIDLFLLYEKSQGIFIPSYKEAYGVTIIEALFFKKVVLTFENSLLIDKNVKMVQIHKNDYSVEDFNQLLLWEDNSNESIIFNSEDTMHSLRNS